jgi:hypothetical protein
VVGTYARAALSGLPGAGRLPFVPGGGREVPERTLERRTVQVDSDHLAAYARVCGFRLRDELPATYPHVLAFPLHMQLITAADFPLAPIGLVQIRNRIAVLRRLTFRDPVDITVRATPLARHPRGREFSLLTTVKVGGEPAWEAESTMLHRGGGTAERDRGKPRAGEDELPPFRAEWRLPGGLGRRYAAVSGDRNPIHMYRMTARLLGFPRAIAHGMWTKARCLAALEPALTERYTVEVEFGKPVLLPGTVSFHADGERFAVVSPDGRAVHLSGRLS